MIAIFCIAQSTRKLLAIIFSYAYVVTYTLTIVVLVTALGPPTLQEFSRVYHVIAGDPFTLNCTATNDPQSPNELRFRWFKESTRIDINQSQWNITELSNDPSTVTSQLIITNLTVGEHDGIYSCAVDNFKVDNAVNQSTIVVIESKLL